MITPELETFARAFQARFLNTARLELVTGNGTKRSGDENPH
jgi:hypothetical protein